MQDCSNSSALAMELLQSCTKPSIYVNIQCQNPILNLYITYIHFWMPTDVAKLLLRCGLIPALTSWKEVAEPASAWSWASDDSWHVYLFTIIAPFIGFCVLGPGIRATCAPNGHMTQCHYDVKTTSRRRFDVIMTLFLRCVSVGLATNFSWNVLSLSIWEVAEIGCQLSVLI